MYRATFLVAIATGSHHSDPVSKIVQRSNLDTCTPNEPNCDEIPLTPFDPTADQEKHWADEEETQSFWQKKAEDEWEARLKQTPNTKKAKNAIIFLGDGMGVNTVTAGRIYKGQKYGKLINAESYKTFIDQIADEGTVGLSKTYCVDRQTPDSAATGTAYLTGVKAKYWTLGLAASIERGNCASVSEESKVKSVLKKAHDAGKATGIVTTTRFHHASPGATYLNSVHRKWYTDADIEKRNPEFPEQYANALCSEENPSCCDNARQFIYQSKYIDVMLAGGYDYLIPKDEVSPINTDEKDGGHKGERSDGMNLRDEWQSLYPEGKVVVTKNQLANVTNGQKILGLFHNKDIPYHLDKNENELNDIPTLAEKTQKAIDSLLATEKDGFYLFVEGGRIDHGHHDSQAIQALEEFAQFDEAIRVAYEHEKLDPEETLIVVTADHSHSFAWGAYGWRGYNILGTAPADIWSQETGGDPTRDDKPINILGYTNGPGWKGPKKSFDDVSERQDLRDADLLATDYQQQSGAPMEQETHGGEDVSIIAKGPWSHMYNGIHEQVYVAHVMLRAQCLEPYEDGEHCQESGNSTTTTTSSSFPNFVNLVLVLTSYFLF